MAVLAQKFWGGAITPICPFITESIFSVLQNRKNTNFIYSVCQESDTLLLSEFYTLVRCIIFVIFVYLHIIYIKCLISEPVQLYCRQYKWTLQQDCAPSHTVKNTINYLKRENVSFIKPPDSPDLNPVDFAVWGALQQQV